MARRREAERKLSGGGYDALGYRAVDVALKSGQAIPMGGSGDWHIRYDRERLMRMSQGFDRDNCLYNGMLSRAVDNIIGSGFSLQARTDSPELNRLIEKHWATWCREPEVRGEFSWRQLEKTTLRSLFRDGDIGAIKTDRRQLQMVEAEQIASSRGVDIDKANVLEQGVVVDPLGRPLQYYVSKYSRYGSAQKIGAVPYAAKDFIFIAHRERFSQTRGVPPCVSAFPMLHRVNDICDSEAIARQMLARLAFAIIREDATTLAYGESKPNDADPNTAEDDIADRIHELPEAIIAHLKPGEKIEGIARNTPGPDFYATITAFLRFAGLPLGLPLELLLLDWSQTNYSSARAALEQAFRCFRGWQDLLRERFHDRVYEWIVGVWVEEGVLPRRADILAHDWITPQFPWLDLIKEATARGIMIDRGMETQGEVLKSLNKDRDAWRVARKREITEAIADAKEIEKETGEKVDYRILCGLPGASSDAKGVEKAPDPAAPAAPDDEVEDDEKTGRQQRDERKEAARV